MNRALLFITILLFFPLVVLPQEKLTIFHINDTHSHIMPWGPEAANGEPQWGGATRLTAKYKELRQLAADPLFLHAGDSFDGDFFFNRFLGRREFEIFDSLGLDAFTLGNHDFDLTSQGLLDALVSAKVKFDVLCANIQYNGFHGLDTIVKPYIIKHIGGLNIGIFGLTTESTTFYGQSPPVTFDQAISTARRIVDTLKAKQVDIILALTHIGVSADLQLADSVAGINLIVGGHSHTPLQTPMLRKNSSGDTTIIVQAGSHWRYLGALELTVLNKKIIGYKYQLYEITSTIPQDPQFTPFINRLVDSVTARYGNVYSDTVGILQSDMVRYSAERFESPLMDLIADGYRNLTRTDAAMEISGFIQQDLYRGVVSTNDLRQMMGWAYDDKINMGKRLSMIQVNGANLKLMLSLVLSLSANYFGSGTAFIAMQVSNIQYTLNTTTQPAMLDKVWVNDRELNDNVIYTVTINEFVADLAKTIPVVKFITRKDTAVSPIKAVAEEIRRRSPLNPNDIPQGRIWDRAQVYTLKFDTAGNNVNISWSAVNPPQGIGFNLYRKYLAHVIIIPGQRRVMNTNNDFQKLNGELLQTSSFTDTTNEPSVVYAYKLEVVTAAGEHLYQPPVQYWRPVIPPPYVPAEFFLAQNYPNPFNPSTSIDYGVKEPRNVSITIHDVLGQQIKTLVDEFHREGFYHKEWDGTNDNGVKVGNGIYFYQMRAGDFIDTKRMVIIR